VDRGEKDDGVRRDLAGRTLNDPPPADLGITPVPGPGDQPSDSGWQSDTAQPPGPDGPGPGGPGSDGPEGPADYYGPGGPPPPPPPPPPTPPPPEPKFKVRQLNPSPHIAQYLFDSERYCGEWRRHWIYVSKWFLGIAGITLLLGFAIGALGDTNSTVIGVLAIVWLLFVLWSGFAIADWYFDKFVLTDKRVMLVEGLVTRRVAQMPLARVTDMAYNQTALGRILDYGTFILESAGQDQALRDIQPLPRPRDLYLLFCQEMYDPQPALQAVADDGGD
jgi:membrane protein YdbS with pleckstrin-like domain